MCIGLFRVSGQKDTRSPHAMMKRPTVKWATSSAFKTSSYSTELKLYFLLEIWSPCIHNGIFIHPIGSDFKNVIIL